MDDERSTQHIESFYNEIVSVGQGACDPELARILVEESGDRVKELVAYGIQFKKTESGRFYRAKGCFSETERALITADYDNLTDTFSSILQQHCVRILTGTVIDLVVQEAVCAGALIFDSKCAALSLVAIACSSALHGLLFHCASSVPPDAGSHHRIDS